MSYVWMYLSKHIIRHTVINVYIIYTNIVLSNDHYYMSLNYHNFIPDDLFNQHLIKFTIFFYFFFKILKFHLNIYEVLKSFITVLFNDD